MFASNPTCPRLFFFLFFFFFAILPRTLRDFFLPLRIVCSTSPRRAKYKKGSTYSAFYLALPSFAHRNSAVEEKSTSSYSLEEYRNATRLLLFIASGHVRDQLEQKVRRRA